MNYKKQLLLGIYYSVLLGVFSIIMGDRISTYEFWKIGAYFLTTFIKAYLVWVTNYYLLYILKPKMNNTLKFVLAFVIINGFTTFFVFWLGIVLFPKFDIIASNSVVSLCLRHFFVIILTYVVLNYFHYKNINQQFQNKYNKLLNQFLDNTIQSSNKVALENTVAEKYTHNFLVTFRHKIIPIPSEKISFFCLENGNLFLYTLDEKKFLFQKTLNKLEKELDPTNFFRINRQIILHRKSVLEMIKLNDRRLKINTNITTDFDLIVSRSNVTNFIKWYNKSSF